jgi:hypothetical protein
LDSLPEHNKNNKGVGVVAMSLMVEIERYLRHSGLPETKFGRLAVNDPRLVSDMRRGRCIGPQVSQRVRSYIAEHRP